MSNLSEATCVCTLAEGDYHNGVAILTNSLIRCGFQGRILVGHRGPRPAWMPADGPLQPAPGVSIDWLTVATRSHLTNHKPEFLLEVMTRLAPDTQRLFYFDPDIVLRAPWSFMEDWTNHGVALVEDVNAHLPSTHPRRGAWRGLAAKHGQSPSRETDSHVNGGFIGITREHLSFLETWRDTMAWVAEEIGGADRSMFSFCQTGDFRNSPAYPYSKTDQDALNLAVMLSRSPVSIMGPEGMDFTVGGWTMSHALGPHKPWRKCPICFALKGYPPSNADREYWRYADGPIQPHPSYIVRMRRIVIAVAAAVTRFYRRPGL